MKDFKNKYCKEELKELVVRLDDCLQERRGFRNMVSEHLTPQILWAYETEDSTRFINGIIPIMNHAIGTEYWEIENIFEFKFEDIPLRLKYPDDPCYTDTDVIFNTILRWRLDCGK